MVPRTGTREVIFSACRSLTNCRDMVQAELAAIEEGLKLALQWSNLPVSVDIDCAEATALIMEQTSNASVFAFSISVIRDLLRERGWCLGKTSRDCTIGFISTQHRFKTPLWRAGWRRRGCARVQTPPMHAPTCLHHGHRRCALAIFGGEL
jgi:hypothetical protein